MQSTQLFIYTVKTYNTKLNYENVSLHLFKRLIQNIFTFVLLEIFNPIKR